MWYATLHQVRSYLKLAASETGDDSLLKDFCRQSAVAVDKYCRRRFDLRLETRLFDYPLRLPERMGVYSAEAFVAQMNMVADWRTGTLRLDADLCEVVTLTNGDDETIAATDYVLEPANVYPKSRIRLKQGSGVNWEYDGDGNREQVIDVEGYWGYHQRYGDAWCDSLDTVQDDPLTAASTTLTVSDADGVAGDATGTRFQVGQLLEVGSEFLFVTAVDTTANELTVVRGENGTTAAAHVQGTALYVYRPPDNIVLACTRLVVWRYRQKDVDTFDKAAIIGTGIAIIPSALPADVRELLPRPKPLSLR